MLQQKQRENHRFESVKAESRSYASSINLGGRDSAQATSYLPTLSPDRRSHNRARRFRLDKKLTSKSTGSFDNYHLHVLRPNTPNDSNVPSPDNKHSDSVHFEQRFEVAAADQTSNFEEDRHSDFTAGVKKSALRVRLGHAGRAARQALQRLRAGEGIQVLLVQRRAALPVLQRKERVGPRQDNPHRRPRRPEALDGGLQLGQLSSSPVD